MSDEHGKFLICLKKDAVHQISNPLTGPGVYTDDDLRCDNQIENYNRAESDYLHMFFLCSACIRKEISELSRFSLTTAFLWASSKTICISPVTMLQEI